MSWNRWTKRVLGGLFALLSLGGCRQQLFMEASDYHDAAHYGLPKGIETNPHEPIVPPTIERTGAGPATVYDPGRAPRYMSLKEVIALALEQGNVGLQNPANPGNKNEVLPQFAGGNLTGTDAIRAYALDPANISANIERSLSKFDTRWVTSMSWTKNDNPVAAQFVSFQSQNDSASFTSTLAKPLPTGGTAGITFSTSYTKYPSALAASSTQFVNPNYIPGINFIFEQPLGQLFGVEPNMLSSSHPTSLLISGLQPSGGTGVEGVLITRIRFDQARANFETQVNYMMMNVEAAYWNLYSAYYTLYAQEDGLRSSFDGYRFTEARVLAGQDPPQNLQQARAQFELFRGNVYQARGQVQETERQLRGLTGLRSDDNTRLVPVDEPQLAQYEPDFYESANEAMTHRPELMLARQDLKSQQLNLILAKNLRRPDVRFFSSYNVQGIGTSLDGPALVTTQAGTVANGNALTNLQSNVFNTWQVGLRADMPLGFRDANAQVRQAQLQITRSYYQLRDTELKTLEYLVAQYRAVYQTHSLIAPAKSRREALQIFVAKTKELIIVGRWDSTVFFNYLQVQRDLAQAIATEFTAIANYNIALAQLEFAKGTIMRYNNVSLSEGPIPDHVAKRAQDHFRERTAAIKLRERPGDNLPPPELRPVGPATGNPFVMPPLTEKREPVPEELPAPMPLGAPGGITAVPSPSAVAGMTPAASQGATTDGSSIPNPLVRPWPAGSIPNPVPQNPTPTSSAAPNPGSTDYFTPNGTLSIPNYARTPVVPIVAPQAGGGPAAGIPIGQNFSQTP